MSVAKRSRPPRRLLLGRSASTGSRGSRHPSSVLPSFAPFVLGALTLALGVYLWRGSRESALTIIVVLLSAYPLTRLRNMFDRGNWGTIQAVEYVLRNSAPWETTFDGFTGLGMFRPQAFFPSLPASARVHASVERRAHGDVRGSSQRRAAPKFIFWSHYLRDAITPEITAFLEEHYVPTGLEPIRVRPFDNGAGWWSDEKRRYIGWVPDEDEAPHVLFDDAWRPPSEEFGLPIRRTRTRNSTLTVPIRYPRDFTVTLRAHADPESVPFGVELVVNGRSAGLVDAVARWQDYAFPVTVHQTASRFQRARAAFQCRERRPVQAVGARGPLAEAHRGRARGDSMSVGARPTLRLRRPLPVRGIGSARAPSTRASSFWTGSPRSSRRPSRGKRFSS